MFTGDEELYVAGHVDVLIVEVVDTNVDVVVLATFAVGPKSLKNF